MHPDISPSFLLPIDYCLNRYFYLPSRLAFVDVILLHFTVTIKNALLKNRLPREVNKEVGSQHSFSNGKRCLAQVGVMLFSMKGSLRFLLNE